MMGCGIIKSGLLIALFAILLIGSGCNATPKLEAESQNPALEASKSGSTASLPDNMPVSEPDARVRALAEDNPTEPEKSNENKIIIDRVSVPQSATKELVIDTYNFGFTMNDIEIKKGDTVRLTMKVTSGTHGISIPAFGVNVGPASAGQEKTVEFVADKSGVFPFRCSIYCGSGHSSMTGKLTVLE